MTELKNWTLSQSQFSLVIVEPKGNIFFGELFTFILFEFALPSKATMIKSVAVKYLCCFKENILNGFIYI